MGAHHTHTTISRENERIRLLWALFVTVLILGAEIAGGVISGSLALISDAGHMFVDSLSLLLSYIALTVAHRSASEKFTFGLQRLEIIAAFVNGVTLLVVCASIVYEGVQRFIAPVDIDIPMMLGVAVIGILANIISAVLLRHSHTLNVRSAFLHVLGDLFSSIGILVAGVAMLIWDVPWLDPALSIAIAGVILISAYRLTAEALSVLMEAAPRGIRIKDIREALLRFPFVEDVHGLHVWTITTGVIAMSSHIVLVPGKEKESDALLAELTAYVRDTFGIGPLTIQMESSHYQEQKPPCPEADSS